MSSPKMRGSSRLPRAVLFAVGTTFSCSIRRALYVLLDRSPKLECSSRERVVRLELIQSISLVGRKASHSASETPGATSCIKIEVGSLNNHLASVKRGRTSVGLVVFNASMSIRMLLRPNIGLTPNPPFSWNYLADVEASIAYFHLNLFERTDHIPRVSNASSTL